MAVDYNDGQYTMSVDCNYVGQSLTFTGMFIFGDCIYNVPIPPAEICMLHLRMYVCTMNCMHLVMGDNCTTTGGGDGGGNGGGSKCVLMVHYTNVHYVHNIIMVPYSRVIRRPSLISAASLLGVALLLDLAIRY